MAVNLAGFISDMSVTLAFLIPTFLPTLPKLPRDDDCVMFNERRQRMRLLLRVFMLWLEVPNAPRKALRRSKAPQQSRERSERI